MPFPIIPIGNPTSATQPVRNWTWNVKQTPVWNTIQQWTPNGGRLGIPLYKNNPLWEWEYTFGYIVDDPNFPANTFYPAPIPYTDLQILKAFWHLQKGAGLEFVYQPWDSVRTSQPLAAVDANNNTELVHTIGGAPTLPPANPTIFTVANESVQELNGGSVTVRVGGVVNSNWTLQLPGTIPPYEGYVIHFTAPPGAGAITADFTYYYRCVFSDDTADFENFMYTLAQLNSLKFRQVRVTAAQG